MAARAGAGRATDWQSVWLSESDASGTVVSWQYRTFLTCVGAASGTSDIADAHVVICARRAGQPVVTSDPGDLRQLDPALRLIAL